MKQALEHLLIELDAVFQRSDIKRLADESGPKKEWHYSLAVTSLEENAPLIVGFNWGAAEGAHYTPQQMIQKDDFGEADKASLARLDRYFRPLFGADFISRVSQTNYCFFRSKNEHQITDADLARCQPIFNKLLEILKPSMIFCFSSKLRDHLLAANRADFHSRLPIAYRSGNRRMTYHAMRGRYQGLVDIVSLPHPNAKISTEVGNAAWRFCFPELASAA